MSHALRKLNILAIDCQTTGGSASRDRLVEIGWMVVPPADPADAPDMAPVTHLIQQPPDTELPPHILKLTGLAPGQFHNAIAPQAAWRALKTQAGAVARANRLPQCPAVIHYARFEAGFLDRLHAAGSGEARFPLEILCSHQMGVRLWPDLPRKGLRAMAGYLGHSVAVEKRCAAHLRATAAIWHRQVRELEQQHGVVNLDQLRAWIERPRRRAGKRIYPMPRDIRLATPQRSGIYRFRRSNGDLLYIGKARSLKTRVNSYFTAGRRHSESTLEMLTQAVGLEVTTTATALEAALLESDEIKRRRPPYNKALSENQRRLRFFSRNFADHSPAPSDACPMGPVPSPDPFAALHALGRALTTQAGDPAPDHVGRLLCMPERHSPSAVCLRQGMDLFLEEFGPALPPDAPWRGLLRIGRLSWQAKLDRAAAEAQEPASEPETEPASDAPFEWTPQAVCSTITAILRRCGFMLRRSRWFSLISESAIAWQPAGKGPGERRMLVIEGGRISTRRNCKARHALLSPPGGQLPVRRRQASLDLAAYDRLRVLTTELRRLVAEDRPVAIRTHRQAVLSNPQLHRLFRWI